MLLPLHDDNPLDRIRYPYMTVGIVGVCVAVFLYQLSLDPRAAQVFVLGFGAIPAVIFGNAMLPPELVGAPAPLTLVTSMFLHGGFLHLLGNMLFLWVLGDNVEDALGHKRFIAFYLLAGIAAAMAHGLSGTASKIPMIGASGAISGIIGAYLVLHPKARIKVLISFFIVWLPAYVVLGFWIGYQIFSASMAAGGAGGGVAWWAHIGGFAAGVLLIVPMRQKGVPLFDAGKKRFELRLGAAARRKEAAATRRKKKGGSRGGKRGPWG